MTRRTAVLLALFVACLAATVWQPLHGSAATTSSARLPHEAPLATGEIPYSTLLASAKHDGVYSLNVDAATGKADVVLKNGFVGRVVLPPGDDAFLRRLAASGAIVQVSQHHEHGSWLGLIVPLLLVGTMVGLFVAQRRRMGAAGIAAGGDMSLRKSAELVGVPDERFTDVAGCDEAVEELAEIAEFFGDPDRYQRLGAKLPSGVMLYGEPGTGKTLLAKAFAGEAGIPFFAMSGSDFVEKFVGVGASRVRELFERARRHPEGAVIFIDEIDAVGRARGSGEGNSERDQTLNQILVELDGFSTTDRVVCIAATNRLDVLDPALLRPGRFGRHIAVPLPAADGRAAILRVHAAGKPLADEIDLDELATSMGGLSGAQLAEVVNEAAIMAGRGGADEIVTRDFREAFLRVLAGPKRRNAPLADGELEVIAYHEAGHVLVAEYGRQYEKAQQVTIEPRGQAMGLAVYGQVDRALHDQEYLHEALMATIAGRAAEQIVFGRISSGAANDLQKATDLARRAVEELGFSSKLGQVALGRTPFSETTRSAVDAEIERMVADAYLDAIDLLTEHRAQLDRLTERLLQSHALERVDILAALGRPSPTRERRQQRSNVRPATALQEDLPLAAAEGAS